MRPSSPFVVCVDTDGIFVSYFDIFKNEHTQHTTKMVERHEVFVNIYDMSPFNAILSFFGLGVYHSGIEVTGQEFYYGGHDSDASGIGSCEPGRVVMPGQQLSLKKRLSLGHTSKTMGEISGIIDAMGRDFKGTRYSVIGLNCNVFSCQFSSALLGSGRSTNFPASVNRMARLCRTVYRALPRVIQESWDAAVAQMYHEQRYGANAARAPLHPNQARQRRATPQDGQAKPASGPWAGKPRTLKELKLSSQ